MLRRNLDTDKKRTNRDVSKKTGDSVSGPRTNKGVKTMGNHCSPFFMISVSIAQVAVYIYYGFSHGEWVTYHYDLYESPLVFYTGYRKQVWRFASYMLIHLGLGHLAVNVPGQLILGVPLEKVHGHIRLGIIYMTGVVAASLATSILTPCDVLVGASGGVYAISAAHLANAMLNGSDVTKKTSGLVRGVLLFASFDLGYSIYNGLNIFALGVKFSTVAHVAGALAGLSVGLVVLKNFKKSATAKAVFWVAVLANVCLMIFAILWNVFWARDDSCY